MKDIIEKMTPEQKQLLQQCIAEGFDKHQIWEVIYGLWANLSIEQVKSYAKKEFHWEQMNEIRLGYDKQ